MIVTMMAAAAALAAAQPGAEAQVRDVEAGWSRAFVTGDQAYLQRLLADDYVSVGQTGEAHPKAVVIAAAARFAAAHPGQVAPPPSPSSTVSVTGDIAIVRHHSDADVSVDVFQLRDGRWVALYSQHTAVKAAGA